MRWSSGSGADSLLELPWCISNIELELAYANSDRDVPTPTSVSLPDYAALDRNAVGEPALRQSHSVDGIGTFDLHRIGLPRVGPTNQHPAPRRRYTRAVHVRAPSFSAMAPSLPPLSPRTHASPKSPSLTDLGHGFWTMSCVFDASGNILVFNGDCPWFNASKDVLVQDLCKALCDGLEVSTKVCDALIESVMHVQQGRPCVSYLGSCPSLQQDVYVACHTIQPGTSIVHFTVVPWTLVKRGEIKSAVIPKPATVSKETQTYLETADNDVDWTPSPQEIAASYVADTVVHRLLQQQSSPEQGLQPCYASHEGCLLLVDIAGFSALTSELSRFEQGPELLVNSLNLFFGPIIDLLRTFGARIETFAGDSIIGYFQGRTRAACVQQAVGCLIRLKDIVEMPLPMPDGSEMQLKHYTALTYGNLRGVTVGKKGHWYHMLMGECFDGLSDIMTDAKEHSVAVAPQVLTGVSLEGITQVKLPSGNITLQASGLLPPCEVHPHPKVDAQIQPLLEQFLPQAVRERVLHKGQGANSGELRDATVVFVGMQRPDLTDETALPLTIQATLSLITSHTERLEGFVSNCLLDEKRWIVVVVFGMPHHADDAFRGVKLALRLEKELAVDLQASFGLASGQILVGPLGSLRRRTFATMGHPVNMAARLMMAASAATKGESRIFADSATRERTADRVKMQLLPGVSLKGMGMAKVYALQDSALSHGSHKYVGEGKRLQNIQLRFQQEALWNLVQNGEQCTLLLGASKSGKSSIIEMFVTLQNEMPGDVIQGAPNDLDGTRPFSLWTQALGRLLSRMGQYHLIDFLKSMQWSHFANVLNRFFSWGLPEHSSLQTTMQGDQLQKVAVHLLLEWIQCASAECSPLVLVLEDLHLAEDQASLELLQRLANSKNDHLLLVCSAELLQNDFLAESRVDPPAWRKNICATSQNAIKDFRQVTVPPMSEDETHTVLVHGLKHMGVTSVQADLLRNVHESTQGSLSLCMSILDMLEVEAVNYDNGEVSKVTVSQGVLKLATAATELYHTSVQSLFNNTALSQLDTLGYSELVLVRHAAVVGRYVPKHVLSQLLRMVGLHKEVPGAILKEVECPMDTGLPQEGCLAFRSTAVLQQAYNQLLFEERRKIHRTVLHIMAPIMRQLQSWGGPWAAHWTRCLATQWCKYVQLCAQGGLVPSHDLADALQSLNTASQSAEDNGDYVGSVTLLQDALNLLDQVPTQNTQKLRLEVLLAMLNPLCHLRSLFPANLLYDTAQQAYHMCPPDHPSYWRLTWCLVNELVFQGHDHAYAYGQLNTLLLQAKEQQNSALLLISHRMALTVAFFIGDYRTAEFHGREAEKIFDKDPVRLDDTQLKPLIMDYQQNVLRINSLLMYVRVLFFKGEFAKCVRLMEHVSGRTRYSDCVNYCYMLSLFGRVEDVIDVAVPALKTAQVAEDAFWVKLMTFYSTFGKVCLGNAEQLKLMYKIVVMSRKHRPNPIATYLFCIAAIKHKQYDEVLEAVDWALEHLSMRTFHCQFHCFKAVCLLQQHDDHEGARSCYDSALEEVPDNTWSAVEAAMQYYKFCIEYDLQEPIPAIVRRLRANPVEITASVPFTTRIADILEQEWGQEHLGGGNRDTELFAEQPLMPYHNIFS